VNPIELGSGFDCKSGDVEPVGVSVQLDTDHVVAGGGRCWLLAVIAVGWASSVTPTSVLPRSWRALAARLEGVRGTSSDVDDVRWSRG
jgi:hypothetical protein